MPPDESQCLCNECEELLYDDSESIKCERCSNLVCIACSDLDDIGFEYMKTHRNMHWFCTSCEEAAIKAVQTDNLIEARCQELISQFEERITKCEKNIENKVDKETVNQLYEKVKILEEKLMSHTTDISNLGHKIDLVRFEPYEKAKRVTNLIIHGIPETGSADQDKLVVSMALADVDCADILPNDLTRLGKLKPRSDNAASNSSSQNEMARPIRISLSSRDEKLNVLKKMAKKLESQNLVTLTQKKFSLCPIRQLSREPTIEHSENS